MRWTVALSSSTDSEEDLIIVFSLKYVYIYASGYATDSRRGNDNDDVVDDLILMLCMCINRR